jgi:phenylacetate-coenzyme A ligase PaaK-like adenylate-forming protein
MPNLEKIENRIFNISGQDEFEKLSLEIFRFQLKTNAIYREFVSGLSINVGNINHSDQIPFLPIEFFKTHKIISGKFEPEIIFTSSGTTGMQTSRHFIKHLEIYNNSFQKTFGLFFGNINDYVILALLPSYLEREGSSLVYMTEKLIAKSKHHESGFYLDDYEKLSNLLKDLRKRKQKVILLGVTYALLDMAEKFPVNFKELIVMETGGMKGRRKEMVREELHDILNKGFGVAKIYSEYGMTELLSQAYSKGDGIFQTPPWMKVLIRDTNDPLNLLAEGKTGGINVIDLANIHSCSFIATQDLGKLHQNGHFEVLGRFDNSDVRGCNLMVV